MSEQRIRELLDEVARPVPAPDLAGKAWRRAGQTRHRRLVVLGAAATVAVVLAGAVFLPPALRGGVPDPAGPVLSGRTFVATSVEENGKPGELPDGEVSLSFTSDGKVNAKLGCGEFSGAVGVDGGRLMIGESGEIGESRCSTVHPQPDWPRELLYADPAFRLDGDTLTLTAGTTAAVFRDFGDQLPGRTFLSTGVTVNGKPSDVLGTAQARLRFGRDGVLYADVGCNSMTYRAEIRGDRIRVGGGSGTDMGCPGLIEVESWLGSFLGNDPAWRLDGATLVLTSGKTELRLLDLEIAEPDVPLEGQTWTAYTKDPDGDGYDSSLFKIQLEFADGEVTGRTGCHSLSGTATVAGNRITFSAVQAKPSEPDCAEGLADADQHARALLDGTLTFDIEFTELHLRSATGAGLSLTSCERVPSGRKVGCS